MNLEVRLYNRFWPQIYVDIHYWYRNAQYGTCTIQYIAPVLFYLVLRYGTSTVPYLTIFFPIGTWCSNSSNNKSKEEQKKSESFSKFLSNAHFYVRTYLTEVIGSIVIILYNA